MALGDIGSIIEELIWESAKSEFIRSIKVTNSIIAIVFCDASSNQKICSAQVDGAGNITDTIMDSLAFNGAWCGYNGIAIIPTNIVLRSFRGDYDAAGVHGWVCSHHVGDSGEIGAAPTDSLKTDNTHITFSNLCHLFDDIIVEVYKDGNADLWLCTFTCDWQGNIGGSVEDEWEYETTAGSYPFVCKVSDTIVAISWEDAAPDGWIHTVSIANDGTITKSFVDSLKFDDAAGVKPRMVHVTGDIFALVWNGPADEGRLGTVSIDSAGNIGATLEDSWEFEAVNCDNFSICNVGDWGVAILFTKDYNDCRLVTVAIAADGTITKSFQDTQDVGTNVTRFSDIVYMHHNLYLLTYSCNSYWGRLKSVMIETPTEAKPQQLMMSGVG